MSEIYRAQPDNINVADHRDVLIDGLIDKLGQLQMLESEGKNMSAMIEQTWERLADLMERRDEEKLTGLRRELSSLG